MDGIVRRFTCMRLFVIVLLVVPAAGCIGLAAQTLYVLKGHKTPAKFDGLKKKKVAIICVADQGSTGSDSVTYQISQLVTAHLAQNVKDIEIIPQSDVEKWKQSNSWEKIDYAEVGRALDAEMVLAIEISSFSLDEGSTMFKGRCEITSTVFDMEKNGTLVFTDNTGEFTYPRNGIPKMQVKRREFEKTYLARLTQFVAQQFYKHEKFDGVENDSAF